MRLANIVTAVSDILAGVAISGYFLLNTIDPFPVLWLIVSTIGLYGGGVVFNDVFDADLDAVERPERPIPSGLIPKSHAALLASVLLAIGVLSAAQVARYPSGLIAALIVLFVMVYDKWAKHHSFFGPVTMGTCRGFNILIWLSIVPGALSTYWFIALIPVLYIGAITMISRGEVHGGKSSTMVIAAVFYGIVIASIVYCSIAQNSILYSSVFLILFAAMIFPPLRRAMIKPEGKRIGLAVKAGVIALIAMNASWAAAFGMIYLAIAIIILLPISLFLARLFAVT
jgi:4-hydroxybenzoate polyprenyltransferase